MFLEHTKPEIRQHKDNFEREVEGLIDICKFLSTMPQDHRDALMFLDIDPHVLREAKRRVLEE